MAESLEQGPEPLVPVNSKLLDAQQLGIAMKIGEYLLPHSLKPAVCDGIECSMANLVARQCTEFDTIYAEDNKRKRSRMVYLTYLGS